MANNKGAKRSFPTIHEKAAGIDIGSRFHVAAVPPDLCEEPVQTFGSFTGDLHRLALWLKSLGITTVAMESTGVYWIPAFEILQEHGIEALLVNARSTKNVPGRKTDVNDAQWIQQLHQFGLLRGSFQPASDIAALRTFSRHRERLLEYGAAHIQHMQKALMQMNVQLHHVVSDICGATGMKIIRAIIAGNRDPKMLASMRDIRCKESVETIESALIGNYRPEHLLSLRHALELFDIYQSKVDECDKEIEIVLQVLQSHSDMPIDPIPPKPKRHRTKQMNEPRFDVRGLLYNIVGTDLTQVHGLGPHTALKLVAECGTDMSRWPTVKHFTSWLTLCPGAKISGGKILSSRSRRSTNRAATLLRLSAVNVGKTDTALGAFYRRLAARIGKAKAVNATARKIAVLFYNTLRYGTIYNDPGSSYYETQYRERVIKGLRKKAKQFGFDLQEAEAAGVS
jgi:transposase